MFLRNKTILIYLIAPLLLLTPAFTFAATFTQTPVSTLKNGLVGFWTMDSVNLSGTSIYDISGNRKTMTSTGGYTKINGKLGGAVSLAGTTTYLKATTVPLNTTAGTYNTIAFWGYLKNTSIGNILFDIGTYYAAYFGTANCLGYNIGVGDAYGITNPSNYLNKWTHYAFVFYNGSYTDNNSIYVNGIKQPLSQCAGTGQSGTASQTITMGSFYTGTFSAPMDIDDVRAYNRALSSSEAKQLYGIGSGTRAGATPNKASYRQNTGINSGLIGWWTFDGADISGTQVYDRSVTGNTATSYGGITKNTGKLGQGLKFDGNDGYIDTLADSVFDISSPTQAFTVTAWIKENNPGARRETIVHKYNGAGTGYFFDSVSGKLRWGFEGPSNNYRYVDSTTSINDNRWHFVVGVSTGQPGAKIYVDGVPEGSEIVNGTFVSADTAVTLKIGHTWNPAGDNYFTGYIDDVRVYNRALSPSEVKQLYNTGIATVGKTPGAESYKQGQGINSGLVGWWTFDGNNGTLDMSGRGNNGTISGGVIKTMGKLGQAMDFNGSTGGISVAGSSITGTNVSRFAWIKLDDTDSASCGGGGRCEIISTGSNSLFEWASSNFCVYGYNFNTPAWVCVPRTITAKKWYHVGFTYDGTRVRIYQDGVDIGGNNDVPGTMAAMGTLYIGYLNTIRFFNGQIDDVRAYNRALSPTEIQQLYRMGK